MTKLEQVTIWKGLPKENITISDIVKNYCTNKPDIKQKGGQAEYKNIKLEQTTDINKNIVNGLEFEYVMIRFSFDVVTLKDDSVNNNGYVIIFSDKDSKLRYFVNKSSMMAQKVLQILFNNYNKNTFVDEIKKENQADFLFWIFANYIDNSGVLESTEGSNNSIVINTVDAIKGSISEKVTTLSAKSNDDIANYISILSFLLETDEVDKLGLAIRNGQNTLVEFVIDRPRKSQTVSVNVGSYEGQYDIIDGDDKICLVLLLVHLEILPQMRSLYSLQEDEWINSDRNKFLLKIGEKIKDNVQVLTDKLAVKLTNDEQKEVSD